jgi:hypothetical protein
MRVSQREATRREALILQNCLFTGNDMWGFRKEWRAGTAPAGSVSMKPIFFTRIAFTPGLLELTAQISHIVNTTSRICAIPDRSSPGLSCIANRCS